MSTTDSHEPEPTIAVTPLPDHDFDVVITADGSESHHTVHVGRAIIEDLDVSDLDETELVHESVVYLLEHDEHDLSDRVDLDQVSFNDHAFFHEVRSRLVEH